MAFFSPLSRRPTRRFEARHPTAAVPRWSRRATQVAIALAVLALCSAHAQSLSDITITGTVPTQVSGFGDVPLAKAPFSAVTIDQQTLQDIGAQRVSDALRLDASVADSYNSPAYWDILSVRGYTLDNRYNYRREGLPISAETMIAMDNKERIELFKGTSGIQAGTSAPGGLVNYVVKRPPSAKGETVRSVSAGHGGGRSSSIGLDLGDRFGQDQALGYRINAAYEDLNPYIRNTEGHRKLFALAMDWRLTPDSKLEWEIERSERTQIGVNAYSLLGGTLPAPVDGTRNITRQPWSVPGVFAGTTGTLRFKHNLDSGWLWTTQYGGQRLRTDDRLSYAFGCSAADAYDRFCSDGSFDLYDYRSDNERRISDAFQTSFAGSLTLGKTRHHIISSISRQRQLVRSPEIQQNLYVGTGNIYNDTVISDSADYSGPGKDLSEFSTEFSLTDRIEIGTETTLWLGARHSLLNRTSKQTDGTESVQEKRTFTTPWLAISRQLSATQTVYASYGEGLETAVTPNKTKYKEPGRLLPTTNSQQFEVGFKSELAATRWKIAFFDISRPQYDDICVDGNACIRQLDGQARHRGLELAAGTTQGAWTLQSSAAWIDAQRQNAVIDPSVNGQRALNVPRMTLRALAQYRLADVPGLRSSLRLSHEGTRRVTEDGSIPLPSWTTVDFATHYDTRIQGTRTQWTLAIDNLADRHYWRESPKQYGHYYLYPGAPRTLRLGVKASF